MIGAKMIEAIEWYFSLSQIEILMLANAMVTIAVVLAALKAVIENLPPQYVVIAVIFLYVWTKTRPVTQ